MDSGVAKKAISDLESYKDKLKEGVFKSALLLRPVFETATKVKRRIVFAEGEDERVLRAAQAIWEETSEQPSLIGRPSVLEQRCERLGLVIRPDIDIEIVNPEDDRRYRDDWTR